MLKYIVILLDDSSTSYCHYETDTQQKLMPISILKQGILFAMKHDLKIQYVLPPYPLPQEYMEQINSMFHDTIGIVEQDEIADIVVINDFATINTDLLRPEKRYVIRISVFDFLDTYHRLEDIIKKGVSFNVVFTDVQSFTEQMISSYRTALSKIGKWVKDAILNGTMCNTNLITDRIALDEMNNCGAGDTSITLAPNGVFYPCPAFYYTKDLLFSEIGNIETGLNILNPRLYTLTCAPLCKQCDAFHCKRCVWLNKKMTLELNTPSHQQCVMAHLERNAARDVLNEFHKQGILKEKKIKKLNYLDPFDIYKNM